MQPSRREFLRTSVSGATLLATGATIPGFLARSARAAVASKGERILVVVQLSGGNDGLNTVVPYRDDLYHRARPSLRIAENAALRLTDSLALHPEMRRLHDMFESGSLRVINNVGYPNPDRSHFRSMDIWHTASTEPEAVRDGWLGRVVDRSSTEGGAPLALHLDRGEAPLALRTQRVAVPSITDIDAFRLSDARIESAAAVPRGGASDDLLFVQRTAVASCANARRIAEIADRAPARNPYPAYGLAQRLQQIAQLITADFGPRVYYTSLGGFDTHARQALAHGPLLRELSDSIAAFFDDLAARGAAERVTLMTFSEFGRRVSENGSQGTDHGAAAPLLVAGPSVDPGVHGAAPNLKNLVEGDVRHELDFRSVYAALLEQWLDVRHAEVLGARYPLAPLFRT